MHLNNAAICFIDEVISEKPSYCLFDWFGTSYNETNYKTVEYIDTILNKCSKIRCKPIFLFLPFRYNPKKYKFHYFCKSHLNDRNSFLIDINFEACKSNLNEILKDDLHTTKYGSELYSKIIYDKFIDNGDNINVPNGIPETKYECIKRIAVNREFDGSIELSGDCEIIGFLLTVGPHSGLVNVVIDGTASFTGNTWDRWCHYTRKKFNLPMRLSENAQIHILQTPFDTSLSKTKFDFEKGQKKLIVHDIYYVGNDLTVDNINDGCRISKISQIRTNALGRMNQYKKKFFESLMG